MVSKAERAHVMLTWAGCFEERRSLSLLGQLYESLVESVVIAGVTTIQMSEKGQRGNSEAKYKLLKPAQTKLLRRWFGVGRKVSTRALLAEVGWVSIEWRLKAAKVRLWDRAKLKVAGRDTNHLVTERMKQVLEGETKGLSKRN